MKKTLLAAALMAGFAGVAQAETSVTLYGILDGGIAYEQIKGKASYNPNATTSFKSSRTGLTNGVQFGSRWGLKGQEDLGNGLRAIFVLESGYDQNTGNSGQGGRLFGRQATLGLASDSWGTFEMGRKVNIASQYLAGVVSPFGASFSQANAGAVFTQANTLRLDNQLQYQTPNFSGFQFGLGYSFNASGAQNRDLEINGNKPERNTRVFTTGVRYSGGPLAAALTYDQFTSADTAVSSPDTNVSAWALGLSYNFEVVKVFAGFGQTRDGFFQTQAYNNWGGESNSNGIAGAMTAVEGLKFNSYSLGLSAPVGNGTIMAGWMMADPRSNPDNWAVGNELDKQQTYSLGYTYNFSKRTSMYAIGSYAKHVNFLPDAKSTLIGVGLVHKF
ncbi:MAG: porin [Burkholderiaceae bacterium]